ncbi:MAG: NAD-dependent epimerase/dehydratase family protein [Nitrospiraceae bacterium]
MKHVLVTGAGGFIGRHFINRLLDESCHVKGFVRAGGTRLDQGRAVEIAEGDILDAQSVKQAMVGVDTVFHLAGKAHAVEELVGEEESYQLLNVQGTQNVMDGAAACGVTRVVCFSSVKAMGEDAPEVLDESSEPRPATAYGRSKLAAERVAFEYGQRMGIHVTCLRLPLVYGIGNKGNLYRMIAAVDRGLFPPWPPLENRRSLVHVSNVIQAALLAADNPAASGRCYVVTDAQPYSTRELYERICAALGKPIPRWHVPLGVLRLLGILGDLVGRIRGKRFIFDTDALAKLAGSAWYSSQRISRELGYRPLVSLESALPDIIAWYRGAKA